MAGLVFCKVQMFALLCIGVFICTPGVLSSVEMVDICKTRPGFYPDGRHLSNIGSELKAFVDWTIPYNSTAHRCIMRFSTCSSCRLRVTAYSSFDYGECPPSPAYKEFDGWCAPGCSYVHLYDQDYSSHAAASYTKSKWMQNFFPQELNFTSESRFLYMVACANRTDDKNVEIYLTIKAEEKKQVFTPSTQDFQLSSPFFPDEYRLNSEIYTYEFQADDDQVITIMFNDWLLSQHSYIEFDKANIQGKILGSNYRPWIISDTNVLKMTFDTGPEKLPGTFKAFKGFSATFAFERKRDRLNAPIMQTNCGWQVSNDESGHITFGIMPSGSYYYDCVWVIKKHPDFDGVIVKVLNYTTKDITYDHFLPSRLEIREGLTSKGALLQSLQPFSPHLNPYYDDLNSDTGFYVLVQGHYYKQKDLVISYMSYKTDHCYTQCWNKRCLSSGVTCDFDWECSDDSYNATSSCGACRNLFRCSNRRCIPTDLVCNGMNNCGDNSDEETMTCRKTTPASHQGSTISIGVIIPLVVACFLVVVVCLLIIFIRRCQRLSRQARREQRREHHLDTVSGSTSQQQRRRNRNRGEHRRGREEQQDDPPSYEDVLSTTPIGYLNLGYSNDSSTTMIPIQPPSYEEAISPGATNLTFSYNNTQPNDLSSDSSSSITVGAPDSVASSSSNDTHSEAGQQRRNRRRQISSSSASSSEDGSGMNRVGENPRRVDNEIGNHGNQVQSPYLEAGLNNSRHSIAKPDDDQLSVSVASHADIGGNKEDKFSIKQNEQEVEGSNCDVITERSPPTGCVVPNHDPENGERTLEAPSVCRTERSPIISAPCPVSPSPLGQSLSGADRELYTESCPELCSGSVPSVSSEGLPERCPPPGGSDELILSSRRLDTASRPSPNRHLPSCVRKARHLSSQAQMKHLSRSMDDIGRVDASSDAGGDDGGMPSRHYHRSMQNLAAPPAEVCREDGVWAACLEMGPVVYHRQPSPGPPGSSKPNLSPKQKQASNKKQDGCYPRRGEQPHGSARSNHVPSQNHAGVSPTDYRPPIRPRSSRQPSEGSGHCENRPRPQPKPRTSFKAGMKPSQDRNPANDFQENHQGSYKQPEGPAGGLQRPDGEFGGAASLPHEDRRMPSYPGRQDWQLSASNRDRSQERSHPARGAHSLDRDRPRPRMSNSADGRQNQRRDAEESPGRRGPVSSGLGQLSNPTPPGQTGSVADRWSGRPAQGAGVAHRGAGFNQHGPSNLSVHGRLAYPERQPRMGSSDLSNRAACHSTHSRDSDQPWAGRSPRAGAISRQPGAPGPVPVTDQHLVPGHLRKPENSDRHGSGRPNKPEPRWGPKDYYHQTSAHPKVMTSSSQNHASNSVVNNLPSGSPEGPVVGPSLCNEQASGHSSPTKTSPMKSAGADYQQGATKSTHLRDGRDGLVVDKVGRDANRAPLADRDSPVRSRGDVRRGSGSGAGAAARHVPTSAQAQANATHYAMSDMGEAGGEGRAYRQVHLPPSIPTSTANPVVSLQLIRDADKDIYV